MVRSTCTFDVHAQSCPTPSGSSVRGILQARILECVAISSSRDLPVPEIEPTSPALAGQFFTTEPAGKHLGREGG